MLQRTGVGQAVNMYPEFIRRFPDLASLAAAPADEIGPEMRPLGRVGRVGQLLRLVCAIQERHDGAIPRDLDALEALPGLEQYSARSVTCMAWGEPFIMLDPNSYRLLDRCCTIAWSSRRPHTDRRLIEALDREVPAEHPRDFNVALLDIGSTLCRNRRPRHDECPLRGCCACVT